MIFILSAKQWVKNSKKLIEEKDYLILDCTDGQEEKMVQYSNTMAMDNFCIPSKLVSAIDSEIGNEYIDTSSAEKLEKEFFRGSSKFATSVLATIFAYLDTDTEINIFIVMRNKAYKYYRKRFMSEFCRVFPEASPLMVIYDDENKGKMKKALRKDLTDAERSFLKKELEKKEKEMETVTKPKNKKKKKKSKNNKGWGFSKKDFDDL